MRTALRLGAAALMALVALPNAALAGPDGDPKPGYKDPGRGIGVVALIDTGINPYSKAFRDNSKNAYKHPSKYLKGYPKKATALRLSLDLPYKKAIKKDAKVWQSVEHAKLYWIPGTRISGAISLGNGGTNCPMVPVPPANVLSTGCDEHRILDDHGHGTMTASRAAGAPNSLASKARIVMIEGLEAQSVRWAAEQRWIDVQSNSWISLVPPPIPSAVTDAFSYAADRMLTLAGSGNGTAYILGGAPTPTYLLSTAPPGVVLVGGHDNGKMTLWSGSPPHVVADAYAGFAAPSTSTGGMRPHPMACCTSAASPYAAGGGVAIVQQARALLHDRSAGIQGKLVACGDPGKINNGPLKDGAFTLGELKDVFFHTAEAHPSKGRDDGKIHWAGDPRPPDETQYGPGGNPFCQGCTTTPLAWKEIPEAGDATYSFVGYGGINEFSVEHAGKVLAGHKAMPERAGADAQYNLDQEIRQAEFSGSSDGTEKGTSMSCPQTAKG
ncbi:MAG: S8/S53 family peptidase [Actinomycetota bacterium]|nr:S8/S53 family peptidase [Actinomycetota bacterium]